MSEAPGAAPMRPALDHERREFILLSLLATPGPGTYYAIYNEKCYGIFTVLLEA
jgi:hypothetical protein